MAGVPVADIGEIVGDLIALRLSSSNTEANCGTVICTETGGCMRMETQGGAQSAGLFQQVNSLAEQKPEFLLSQQVQRWGREALFEERDFIIKSANFALHQEFGVGLTDEGVHILDPFTGTGTFMVRLLQSGLIKPQDLKRKFSHEFAL